MHTSSKWQDHSFENYWCNTYRSKTQGIALSLGDRITSEQKKRAVTAAASEVNEFIGMQVVRSFLLIFADYFIIGNIFIVSKRHRLVSLGEFTYSLAGLFNNLKKYNYYTSFIRCIIVII